MELCSEGEAVLVLMFLKYRSETVYDSIFWLVVGGFWLDVGGCGWFWVVLGGFGWFWVVLDGFGWFWVVCTFSSNDCFLTKQNSSKYLFKVGRRITLEQRIWPLSKCRPFL